MYLNNFNTTSYNFDNYLYNIYYYKIKYTKIDKLIVLRIIILDQISYLSYLMDVTLSKKEHNSVNECYKMNVIITIDE